MCISSGDFPASLLQKGGLYEEYEEIHFSLIRIPALPSLKF